MFCEIFCDGSVLEASGNPSSTSGHLKRSRHFEPVQTFIIMILLFVPYVTVDQSNLASLLMGSTVEAIDQDMLATDCSPIHPRLLGRSRFQPCLRPGCFLLSCMLKTCMLLSMGIGDHSKSHQGGSGDFKNQASLQAGDKFKAEKYFFLLNFAATFKIESRDFRTYVGTTTNSQFYSIVT